MFTILDLLNHYLGFFNVNSKWKGRVYSLLAGVGDFYILYLAIMHIQNGAYLRGFALTLAFIVIAYFAILNLVYYFTEKTLKWDVSPKIEKVLGGKPTEVNTEPTNIPFTPATGLYAKDNVLPGTAISDSDMLAELTKVAEQLQVNGMMPQNYSGLSEKEQFAYLTSGQSVIYANHPGTPLPYYRLEKERGGLAVYGGMNEMFAQRLARIETVGLQPTALAMDSYDLFIASAVITGGVGHERGRQTVQEVKHDYRLSVELAYRPKGK